MKLASSRWTPEIASKSFIDTVRSCKSLQEETGGSAAELISAMAGGYGSQMMIETWSQGDDIATSIGLTVAASHTAGRHVCIVPDEDAKEEYCHGIQQELQGVSATTRKTAASTEVIVAPGEDVIAETMERLQGVDFLVVDCRRRDSCWRVLRHARFGRKGAVVICKNITAATGSMRSSSEKAVIRSNHRVRRPWLQLQGEHADGGCDSRSRIIRGRGPSSVVYSSELFPMGTEGLMMEIAHVAAVTIGTGSTSDRPGDHKTTGSAIAGSEQAAGRGNNDVLGRARGRWVVLVDHKSGEEHLFRR